jgi:hypothetical protein
MGCDQFLRVLDELGARVIVLNYLFRPLLFLTEVDV